MRLFEKAHVHRRSNSFIGRRSGIYAYGTYVASSKAFLYMFTALCASELRKHMALQLEPWWSDRENGLFNMLAVQTC